MHVVKAPTLIAIDFVGKGQMVARRKGEGRNGIEQRMALAGKDSVVHEDPPFPPEKGGRFAEAREAADPGVHMMYLAIH
jgi:hypothetical protein